MKFFRWLLYRCFLKPYLQVKTYCVVVEHPFKFISEVNNKTYKFFVIAHSLSQAELLAELIVCRYNQKFKESKIKVNSIKYISDKLPNISHKNKKITFYDLMSIHGYKKLSLDDLYVISEKDSFSKLAQFYDEVFDSDIPHNQRSLLN